MLIAKSMKKITAIYFLLLVTFCTAAQSTDHGISVKKKPVIRIDPDSMYFNSFVSRKFKIRGVPSGYTIKGDFNGLNVYVHDSTIVLQPWAVYRDSDVLKAGVGRLFGGEHTTAGDYFIEVAHIRIYDEGGRLTDSIIRNCYVKPESYRRSNKKKQ